VGQKQPISENKERLNRNLVSAGGLLGGGVIGAAGGMAAGMGAEKLMGDRINIGMNVARRISRIVGTDISGGYAKEYAKRFGEMPKTLPPSYYLPLAGLGIGALTGPFIADYYREKSKERDAGNVEITPKKYMKGHVIPMAGGVAAGVVALALGHKLFAPIKKTLTKNKLFAKKLWGNRTVADAMEIGALVPASIKIETVVERAIKNKYDSKINKEAKRKAIQRRKTMDINVKIAQCIINGAIAQGYNEEVDRLEKEASAAGRYAREGVQWAGRQASRGAQWAGRQSRNLAGSGVGRFAKNVGQGVKQVYARPKETFKAFGRGGDSAVRNKAYYGLGATGAVGAGGGALAFLRKRETGQG